MSPSALIFDVDGTLVDTVDLHALAWRDAFRRFGHDIPFAELRGQIGKGGDQLLPVFLDAAERERCGEAIDGYRSERYKARYLPLARGFAGVRALFAHVRARGQKIALASSAKADELAIYKRLADVEGLVDAETTSDDVARSKPYPDIFGAALDRLGVPAAEAIVIGDTHHDVEAGRRLGVGSVGLLCGGFPGNVLVGAGALAVYDDPQMLHRRYDQSPLA